ncbi:hypothetical protein DWU95_43155, partial [Burkholderia contaminans]
GRGRDAPPARGRRPVGPGGAGVEGPGGVPLRGAGTPRRIAGPHDHDLGLFADHADLDAAPPVLRWRDGRTLPLGSIAGADVPTRFGYVASPAQQARDTTDSGN